MCIASDATRHIPPLALAEVPPLLGSRVVFPPPRPACGSVTRVTQQEAGHAGHVASTVVMAPSVTWTVVARQTVPPTWVTLRK
jgi:hypothetical protein